MRNDEQYRPVHHHSFPVSTTDFNRHTHSLSRTSTRGQMSPTPMTKLIILATSVSHPASTNTPPKNVEPKYPAVNIIGGWPPSTMVAPPTMGSIETRTTVPPVSIACENNRE